MDFGNRWYDKNQKVSLAMGCIEQADAELRSKLAKLIIKHAMEMNVTAKKPSVGFFRRWYDKDPALSLAVEYFKNCDDTQRIAIADHILSYVHEVATSRKSP